jgi:lysophospholipid acyltransferase (LPLAT)-like uncharacterized protein
MSPDGDTDVSSLSQVPLVKLRSSWMIRVAAWVAASVARIWLATVRARVWSCDGRVHPPSPDRERFIYAFWHESFLAPAKIRTDVKALVSQSADGELIAQVCHHLGLGTIRGSSKRGGVEALLQLLDEGAHTHLAITPDGPRGPRRQLKSGIILLASLTGLPIAPLGIGFTHAWRFRSWDRFAVPYPFSTVVGVIGRPLAVPRDLDAAGIEHHRRRVEDALLAATQAAEQWAGACAAGRGQAPAAPVPTPPTSPDRWLPDAAAHRSPRVYVPR